MSAGSNKTGHGRRVPLFRLSYWAWVIIPALIYGGYLMVGLPHVIWSYQFTGTYSDLSSRVYHRCTWIGPHGVVTRPANNGTCGLIRFFKERDGS